MYISINSEKTEKEKEELAQLEWKYSYEDISLFRAIANAYYKKNKAHIEKLKKEAEEEYNKKAGFFSKMFSGGPAVKVKSLALTPNLLKELQDTISKSDIKKGEEGPEIPEEVQTSICFACLLTRILFSSCSKSLSLIFKKVPWYCEIGT